MSMTALFMALLCCCGAQAQTTSSSSSNGSKGVIAGRVIGADGQPLSGVTVRAVSPQSGSASARPSLTDEEGRFQFTGLTLTAYSLSAALPAHVTASMTGGTGEAGLVQNGDVVTITMVKGGVITGRVIDSTGEPVPGLRVKAVRLRDAGGKPVNASTDRRTDDRGVYRIFGLSPGVYVVHTDGATADWSWLPDEYIEDAPTYHPSSSRDTATELALQNGVELNGIDIRYRGERGHSVSGKLFDAGGGGGSDIYLQHAASGEILASDWRVVRSNMEGVGFEIRGVADGEYDLVAERLRGDDDGAVSSPQRVSVRGANVSGVELRMRPLASVTGKMSMAETKSENKQSASPGACAGAQAGVFEEASMTLLPETGARRGANSATARSATPSRQGDFKIRHLNAGRYRFDAQLPTETWYAQSISRIDPQTKRPVDLARNGLAIKSGEKLSDVNITIGAGAASLNGRVKDAEGRKPPTNLKVHLIPAEKESVEDILRYFEVKAADDGAFAFNHVAPGRYLMTTRALPDESTDQNPIAWDNAGRLKLRRAAEILNIAVEFQPCQKIKGYELKYAQPSR
ncbi:MAG: carboxypeptidase regulatory-like domain-containing protein [Chloracidobacterium sp.]|nr:carboxypeptidase regulatory-like domain-containing protein [Chloracidobacterium sp.]